MLTSGMILLMPCIMLSDMIYPIESMPRILQTISDIVPASWFISACRKLMIMGVSITLDYRPSCHDHLFHSLMGSLWYHLCRAIAPHLSVGHHYGPHHEQSRSDHIQL